MSGSLTPDTALALMQASQGNTSEVSKGLKAIGKEKELQKIEGAARDFEAMFVAEMMKPMFEGISTEAPFGGGKGEEVFRSILLQEYGKLMAQTGSIGLTSQVKEEMIRMQELSNNKGEIINE